ncbi:lanthionine synthetase [Steroidobacter agaridevorans]|uniref:Lanthionine synthetase n=2 Tax=Steroidobacter agaridevorans TaxID=2695856 RepID=A0A829YC87_9GAMM|nr:lanthionine synthetase [Steroidobacter agaridevorans]
MVRRRPVSFDPLHVMLMNAVTALDVSSASLPEPHPVLATIEARARFLWERVGESGATGLSTPEALNRWIRWQYVAGDEAALHKRLQWDSLDPAAAQAALDTPAARAKGAFASWVALASAMMSAARDMQPGISDPILDSRHPTPYEDLLLPMIHVARTRLRDQSHPSHRIADSAMRYLERSLLGRLAQLCIPTFHAEFVKDLPFGEALLNALDERPAESAPRTERYRSFVQRHLRDGFTQLFLGYPVLARLIATVIEFWVEAGAELLSRLSADEAAIARIFESPDGQTPGRVVKIDCSLSDPHERGRSVAMLTFASGLRVVYKPKDVALESVFGDLIRWCNERSGLPHLRSAQVLERGGYGWVEFMSAVPCADEHEARLFYTRAGSLLALLYILRATDCHYENIVAHGAFPVLVDMETLLHHEPKLIDDSAMSEQLEGHAVQTLFNSVLRTGLLPRWEAGQDLRSAYDISGLGGAEDHAGPRQVTRWVDVNTDSMRLVTREVQTPWGKNVALLGEQPLSPHHYQQQIVEGFTAMYRFLAARADDLLTAPSPLLALRNRPVRFIFRRTRTYGAILEAATAPEHLTDGADFSIELDHLARAFLVAQDRPTAFPILRAEHRSMQQLDVPLFTASADADALTTGSPLPVHDYFRRSSFDDVRLQIQRMSDADLSLQVAIINGAFDAKIATVASRSGSTWKAQAMPVPSRQQLIAEAVRIGEELTARAIPSGDGGVNWIGLEFIPHVERFQQIVLNNSLCDGRGGVALFLAALSKMTGDGRFAESAYSALSSIKKQIHALDRQSQVQVARLTGIGGATGIASTVYSLVQVARFLGNEALLDDAERMASWLTPELIAADEQLDVMSGAAGAVLALCALYETNGSSDALEIARSCARHLVSRQGADPNFPLAWKGLWPRPLTGYSHGAAGVAYALYRLFHLTRDESCLMAANKAVAYEAALFDPTRGNWPDFRSKADTSERIFAIRWCHGAPGIGLGRLGAARYIDDRQVQLDISHALETTAACELTAIDHLCCGNFGRIEVLLVGAEQCQQDHWRHTAYVNAANVIARAGQKGAYQLFPNLPCTVFNPGFLAGSAGIGYQLLRLADPSLPSVLLWE